ncbi:MAG TPA: hypothetical protein VGS06_08380 [Streptosporangiaceae bacterium]|nr:hypothetical protein [Streptosporangiaceae bacterium]
MGEIDEAELLNAGQRGAALDGMADGRKRIVQAAVLRRCCHELKDRIDPRGLRLANAVVTGELDLTGLVVPFPLRFDGCEFDAAPVVEGAQLFELSLTGSPRLPGLLGNGLRVQRDLDLSRSHIAGAYWTSASTSKRAAVWLCEAEIGGRLLCLDTVMDGLGDRALQADRIRVGGAVRLLGQFHAEGEIRLIGARISGTLDLSGAQIVAPGGPALNLEDAVLEGSMFLIESSAERRPEIRGGVAMGSMRIAGRLLIRNAVIEPPADAPRFSTRGRPGTVGAAVDASGLSVGGEVILAERCAISGRIDMSISAVSNVSVGGGCVLRAPGRTALDLTNSEIRADLWLGRDAVVEGTIRLAGAVIHGTLALRGQLSQPERRSLVGATALTVDGDVSMEGLRTEGGRVNFRGATLGSLAADGAQLHNPGGYSVSLNQARVKGSVRLTDGFTSTGLVVLNRSVIEGRLQFYRGSFTCPCPGHHNVNGHAIEAISATVRGGMDLGWKTVSPSVDFTEASTTFLADDPATWPASFSIAGLTYERFERLQGAPVKPIWDQAARCAWLSRQTQFDSGPYQQAARVFRQHGYASEAEQILMAERRHARRVDQADAAWPRRVGAALYAVIGYGYRPLRVLWALAVLLLLVTISLELPASQATLRATNGSGAVYATSGLVAGSAPARSDSCGDGAVRCFSPVLYAIDTVVPLISLEQRSTWYPDPHVSGGEVMLWWLNIATLLGWVLSSIFVVSLTRFSRST